MNKVKRENMEWDSGDWNIEDGELMWDDIVPPPNLLISDKLQIWIEQDATGDLNTVFIDGEVVRGEQAEQLLELYKDDIEWATEQITNAFVQGFKDYYKDSDVVIRIEDEQWYNANKQYRYVKNLYQPFDNVYIILIKGDN